MKSSKSYFLLSISVFIISIGVLLLLKKDLFWGNLLLVVITYFIFYKNSIDIGKHLLKNNSELKEEIAFNQLMAVSVFELDEKILAEIKDIELKQKIRLTKKLVFIVFFNILLTVLYAVIWWFFSY